MAINKKLIHFKNKTKFDEELAKGNINEISICFIKDTKQIWTHGQLYDCDAPDLSKYVTEDELSDLIGSVTGGMIAGIKINNTNVPLENGVADLGNVVQTITMNNNTTALSNNNGHVELGDVVKTIKYRVVPNEPEHIANPDANGKVDLSGVFSKVSYEGTINANNGVTIGNITIDGTAIPVVTQKYTKESLGLGDVDNTSDAEKSVLYAETAGSAPASDVYAWAKATSKPTYNKTEIGLGNVDNTADSEKYVNRARVADVAGSVDWDDVQNAPTALKNPKSLKFGSKTYDGSSEATITASDLGLASALKYCGITSTPLVDQSTTNPVVINGSNHNATEGCIVFYGDKEFAWNGSNWEELGFSIDLSGYKTKQTAVSSPTAQNASSLEFISDITQNENGVITATKKFLPWNSVGETNVQSDWNVTDTSSDAFIKNKPALATVATSGSYTDLSNKPTIPTVPTALSQFTDDIVSGKYLPISGGTMQGNITLPIGYNLRDSNANTLLGTDANSNFKIGSTNWALMLRSNGTHTINGNALIHAGNIGSQSVSYAKSAGTATDQTARDAAAKAQTTANNKWTYNEDIIKGVKVDSASDADTVNGLTVLTAVPANAKFTDNNTTYTFTNGTGGFSVTPSGGSAQTVTVSTPKATSSAIGGIKVGYATSGYNQAVQLDSDGKAYVAVYPTDISGKVDKVTGKGLSTNDYTTAEKNKLAAIASGAEVNVQSDWNVTDSTSDAYIKNKPTIPSAVTSTTVSNWGFTKNAGTVTGVKINGTTKSPSSGIVDLGTVITDVSGKQEAITGLTQTAWDAIVSETAHISSKYVKPSTGIPKSDLASAVQTSLGKADTALQSETYKGTVTSVATGKGLTGGTITGSGTIKCNLNSETSLGTIGTTSRLYAVGVDANNKLCVNVPWSDTNTWPTLSDLGGQASIFDLSTIRSNATNGNTAYKWGNHASAGYVKSSGVTSVKMTVPTGLSVSGSPITSSGTLAVTFTSGYSIPTTAKQGNWDTAYGWGNHSGKYVTLSGNSTVNGSITATSFLESSDETLKNFGEDIKVDFEALRKLPKKYFTWKEGDEQQIGTSAQEVQKLYPEIVGTKEDGTLAVDYGKLSVVALKAVDELYEKNKELEERLSKLEQLILNNNGR